MATEFVVRLVSALVDPGFNLVRPRSRLLFFDIMWLTRVKRASVEEAYRMVARQLVTHLVVAHRVIVHRVAHWVVVRQLDARIADYWQAHGFESH